MEQIDRYKYGNIHNLIYFNMDRFNQPTDTHLIDAMADYVCDYIKSMNDFNFDNFCINGINSMPVDEFKDYEKDFYKLCKITERRWGDEIYFVNHPCDWDC